VIPLEVGPNFADGDTKPLEQLVAIGNDLPFRVGTT
jgi:hypothetical protein